MEYRVNKERVLKIGMWTEGWLMNSVWRSDQEILPVIAR